MTLHKFGALALACALLSSPFAPAVSAAAPASPAASRQDDTPGEAEQAAFTRGQNLYNQNRYDQAATAFRDFLKNYPNSIITDLTLLWLGRTYIALNRIKEAEGVAQQLRTIKDTPFVEIYEGELQVARRESAARPAPTQPAVPAPSPTRREQRASATPTPAVPQPTPSMIGRITPGRRGGARPRPTPALGEEARNTPTLTINSPTPTPTPTRPLPTPQRAGRRGARTAPGPRRTPVETASVEPLATPTPTPARVRPAATPRPTSVAAVPTPTPRRTQIAAAVPTPAPMRAAPNESVTTNPPVTNTGPGTQDGVVFTVKQVPNLSLALRRAAIAASPGQSVQLPLTITNSGNKEDQFRLETDLPAEYQPTFSLAAGGQDTGLPILVTPLLTRGQNLEVMLNARVPETATDGLQRSFIVRAASQADFQINRVADAQMTIVAALLAGSSALGKDSVLPGETFTQTINVRNQGSAAARSTRADFVFSPDFEMVNANPLPLFYDSASRTAVWSLGDLDARGVREINVTLRAMPDALASNRTVGRGIMRTASLPVPSNFDGPSINVGRVARARIEAVSAGLTTTPGDVLYIPFVARNPGNYPESYSLRIVTAPTAPAAVLYSDTNGDGQHQDGEVQVTQTAQLEPRGGSYPLLLRVEIPRNTRDREQFAYSVVSNAAQSNRAASEANTVLTVAAPRVRVRAEQVAGENAPGDVSFYRLVLVNEGGGLAKNLSVTELLPAALQVVDTNPKLDTQGSAGDTQRLVWRVAELAPGDTSVLLVTVRLRSDLSAGSTVTTTRTWAYQDTNGNTYQNQ